MGFSDSDAESNKIRITCKAFCSTYGLNYNGCSTWYMIICWWMDISRAKFFMVSSHIAGTLPAVRAVQVPQVVLAHGRPHCLAKLEHCWYPSSIFKPDKHTNDHTSKFETLGAVSIRKTVLPGMAIPMLKIRRPNGRLIFNMEITIRR